METLEKRPWSEEQIRDVAERLARDESYGRIANDLGRTRSSIGGLAGRLKKSGESLIIKKPKPAPEEIKYSPLLVDKEIVEGAPTLVELKSNGCRYPVGQNRELITVFCGEQTRAVGCAWCETHYNICYTPRKTR